MRLEKYLVQCGVASRKKIKAAIAEGRVTVNGKIEVNDATDVEWDEDIITFDGFVPEKKQLKYYIMYKIAGYITAMEDENKKTVADLLPENINRNSVFPVGRLDKDTEGLLLFTSDGDLSHAMAHPDRNMEKTYYVELDKDISLEDISALENGVVLDTNYTALPGKVEYLSSKSIHLTITEGKYHQVKKMLKAVKNKVVYLKRVKFGNLTLDGMIPGEVKEIKREDIHI
ncbi:pseudouridine synthase [Candidatus Cetobacterium colombiensis]|uniref:Pseudouridine synthase n=1 Tax=Candidatus Cetobacterium colombiensis TaxID=3073100 RepID=A0ABU4W8Z8_9FUSO|nr:pseudouridine synthase [Candidatus Cetobacterium colombiensis]MDX8335704.1 pseudouridine synthase [Candidatus Cetobacterium colombiensis]